MKFIKIFSHGVRSSYMCRNKCDKNEISLLNDKYKREDYEKGTTTKILSNKNYDLSKLKDNEIKIINTIIKLLKDKNVTDISEMSHKEEGWKKTKRYEKISFEYAMNLNIIK